MMREVDYFHELSGYMVVDLAEVLLYFWPGFTVFLTMVVCWLGVPRRSRRGLRRQWGTAVAFSMLAGYTAIILLITIFSREPGSRTGIDLMPFSIIGYGARGDAWVFENVLLFIPYGCLLPCTWQRMRKGIWTPVVSLLFSLMIESCQYLTKRGHMQTDDVITNVAGAILGYFLFHLVYRLLKWVERL